MSTEAGSDGGSRLSKTNRADPQKRCERPSAHESRKQPLSRRDGITLRNEVRDLDNIHEDRPISWARTMNRFDEYLDDKEDVKAVFEDDAGNTAKGSQPHRFAPEYADKQYAKLKDLERGISEDYGKLLHTAMLTFTASATPDGDRVPPADHLDELNASWDAIRRSLKRQLDGRRWEYLAILEPHGGGGDNHGYLHIHMAVFVEGVVSKETFAPVIEAHLRNCEYAGRDAHNTADDSTISVRHAGADRDLDDDEQLDELAIYLAEYLGTYGEDPREAPEHVKAANALLWATGKQRWRPSNGAQQYMAADDRETSENWELVGIEKDGELLHAGAEGGGVDTFTTGSLDPPDDPVNPGEDLSER